MQQKSRGWMRTEDVRAHSGAVQLFSNLKKLLDHFNKKIHLVEPFQSF